MSWSTHLRSAQDFVTVGDVVKAQILTLDKEDRKMSLGIKQLSPDPLTDITSKFPVGHRHTGILDSSLTASVSLSATGASLIPVTVKINVAVSVAVPSETV